MRRGSRLYTGTHQLQVGEATKEKAEGKLESWRKLKQQRRGAGGFDKYVGALEVLTPLNFSVKSGVESLTVSVEEDSWRF